MKRTGKFEWQYIQKTGKGFIIEKSKNKKNSKLLGVNNKFIASCVPRPSVCRCNID